MEEREKRGKRQNIVKTMPSLHYKVSEPPRYRAASGLGGNREAKSIKVFAACFRRMFMSDVGPAECIEEMSNLIAK